MDTTLTTYFLFWVCILGLCLGSFYNVVILRSLSNESIVFPASKCPKCNNKLKPWHNIPVLSYLFLRGKCAYCKESISIQYPIIELITMGLFALSFIKFGLTYKTLFAMLISSCLIIMTTTDIKEKLVDCNIAIIMAIAGLLYGWLINGNILDSIYGLIAGIIIIEAIAWSGFLIAKTRALGEADTYIAAAIGACFGLNSLLLILSYSLIASMFFIIPMFLYKQLKNGNKLTCILFILFILSALVFKTVLQNWFSFGILIFLGIALTFTIIKRVKSEEPHLFLPLVPAFTLGTLYFLFF